MPARKLSGEDLALALAGPTGHVFRDTERLRRALTHASARHATGFDYERMEFLGDRVLGLVVAEHLFAAYPEAPEGELSLRLNALVNADTLAAVADEIGLSELIHVGSEIRRQPGAKRVNIRADALEALIAALHLDGGLEAAKSFILRWWGPRAASVAVARRDPKTALQEWAHQAAAVTPAYAIDTREGPDHEPLFTVSVRVGDFAPETGTGRSKREAEQAAATRLLIREGVWTAPETTL
jgi:ribonuclease-3